MKTQLQTLSLSAQFCRRPQSVSAPHYPPHLYSNSSDSKSNFKERFEFCTKKLWANLINFYCFCRSISRLDSPARFDVPDSFPSFLSVCVVSVAARMHVLNKAENFHRNKSSYSSSRREKRKFFYSLSWKFFIFFRLFSLSHSSTPLLSTPIFTHRRRHTREKRIFIFHASWKQTFTSLKFFSLWYHTQVYADRIWKKTKNFTERQKKKRYCEGAHREQGEWVKQTIQFHFPLRWKIDERKLLPG